MSKKDLLNKMLNDINEGKEPRHTDYEGIDQSTFVDVLEIAIDERFIKNASVTRTGQGGKNVMYFTNGVKITLPGINYLEEHNV